MINQENMNPALKRLGYGPQDRVVIFHMDDLGAAQATLPAFKESWAHGVLSSVSVMVPCPWLPGAIEILKSNSTDRSYDVGVHLTLTSEWENYRWRPLTGAKGLLDSDGYFPNLCECVSHQPNLSLMKAELQAQIDKIKNTGITLTHIDSHMFCLFTPEFLPLYFELGYANKLPALFKRGEQQDWLDWEYTVGEAERLTEITKGVEARGMPLADEIIVLPLTATGDRLSYFGDLLADLKPGLTVILCHPNQDSPEIRAMAGDWQARVEDYLLFTDPDLHKVVKESGVSVIGFSELKNLLRQIA
jgi:predicted glycoside hydrolase/deacetylase ChbG (UPF0249 family)